MSLDKDWPKNLNQIVGYNCPPETAQNVQLTMHKNLTGAEKGHQLSPLLCRKLQEKKP